MQKHILIVDDGNLGQVVLAEKLRHNGYLVSVAGNGKDALELLPTTMIDLIIVDIIMPIMDGGEFLIKLRNTDFNETPTIVMTNFVEAAELYEIQDYITKMDTSLDSIVTMVGNRLSN